MLIKKCLSFENCFRRKIKENVDFAKALKTKFLSLAEICRFH